MKHKSNPAIFLAILAAALYALNAPFSKLLLNHVSPTMMAALLYLGAGIGMGLFALIRKAAGVPITEAHLTRRDIPYTIGMILLDIIAPIFLMIGLNNTTSANVSLLNNFEIVATTVIALAIFKEAVSKRLWLAMGLITLSSMILSFEDVSSFHFSLGSVFVLLACVCWGFENNCTRKMSESDPLEIVIIKGFGSGIGALLVAFWRGAKLPVLSYLLLTLLLGFVAYGLSIFFYVYAQRKLGAAKTSLYYAVSPFIGVLLSLLIFQEVPGLSFLLALVIMIVGTYLASTDSTD